MRIESGLKTLEAGLEQWAFAVVNLSSDGVSSKTSPNQINGTPISDACDEGAQQSWCTGFPDSVVEWMEWRYVTLIQAFAEEIYESLNPGAVESV